jgi:hypothetical protein
MMSYDERDIEPPTEMTRAAVDDEITRATLKWYADTSDDDVLRDIARDVLAGHTTLIGALRSSAYGDRMAELLADVGDDRDLFTAQWFADQAQALADFEEGLTERYNITLRD